MLDKVICKTNAYPTFPRGLYEDDGSLYRSSLWWSLYSSAQNDNKTVKFISCKRNDEITASLPVIHGVRIGGGDDHVHRYLEPWLGRKTDKKEIVTVGSWNSGWFSPLMSPGAEADLLSVYQFIINKCASDQIIVWPYLNENLISQVARKFPQALILPCDSDGIIPVGDEGFVSWMQKLKSSRRKKVNREITHFSQSGAKVKINTVENRIPELADLFTKHKASHGGMNDTAAMIRLLEGQAEIFGTNLYSIESHISNKLHAACTVIHHENTLRLIHKG